jgi:membrane protein implicated in regulation of membrane protease activity
LGCLIIGLVFSVLSIIFDDILGGVLDSFDISAGGALNSTVLVSGLAVFGAAGYIMTSNTLWDSKLIFLCAILVAVLFSVLFYFLYIKPMRNAESTTGFSQQELVGKEGEIILTIPPKGYGEVLINVGAAGNTGQIATSEIGAIKQGTRVIVQAVKEGVVYVLPITGATKKHSGEHHPAHPKDPLLACYAIVTEYLRENKSTPWFREKLIALAERLDTFGVRCEKIRAVTGERFGADSLSYGKYLTPVNALQDYLIGLVTGFVTKLQLFHEGEYSRKIGEFTENNQSKEAQSYQELEQEYKNYGETALAAFDEAILRLDKLTLEIAKLDDADTVTAMNIMHDLDSLIKDTQLYK